MADEKSTIDAALQELASLGRRIAELASTFESRRGSEIGPRPDVGEPPQAELKLSGPAPSGPAPSGDGTTSKRRVAAPPRSGRSAPRRRGGVWLWRGRPVGPMVVSTGLHVAALLILALVFVTYPTPPERLSIVATAVEDVSFEDVDEVEIESIETAEPVEFESLLDPAPAEVVPLDPQPVAIDALAAVAENAALDSVADVGSLSMGDLLASFGGEAGGGKPGGGGGGGGDGMSAPATFFGKRGSGKSALFMCDNSASYADGGFQAVLLELSRAVAQMKPDQSFHVVFFSDAAYPLLHPEGIDTVLPATPENKRKFDAWLGTVELCVGGQGIRGAADLAVRLKPDVIYFLSDGDHVESVIDRMVSLPLDGTVVHTFGMQADVTDRRTGLPDARRVAEQQERNRKLTQIATAHGGSFTPVVISPQAALAASVRPIKENRTRGTVWGTNLPAGP